MKWTSMIAIYALFWVMAAIFLLPVGLRTPDETGDQTLPGHARSAPVNFNPRRLARRATVLGLVFFAIYYANYVNGWIGTDALDVTEWFPGLLGK